MSILLFVLNILVWCSPAFGIEEIQVTIPEQNRRNLIKFSHQYHLQDIGLFCTDCHKQASGSSSASDNILPKEENCADCHLKEVEDEAKCGKCHHDNTEFEPFENPKRVIDFPHKFHLKKADLSCQDCHNGMNKTDYASRKHWPTMPECAMKAACSRASGS